MNITREDKKAEAIERMKLLDIFAETRKQFERDDYVSISEPPVGAFFWAEGEDLQRIRSYTTFGKMDCYLYVSDHRDEWEQDREDLKNREPPCYVYNHDMPDCSEFGCVGIEKTCAAGLCRTW